MCIRDRAVLVFPQLSVTTHVFVKVPASGHDPATKEPEVFTCLLYTSDAADDLLCVDLGGRRIIKKNNTTYIRKKQYNSNNY